jgi:diacylglycerol O-acyltransferase
MKPLSPTDTLFLLLERRSQPMHVGSLLLLEPPAGAAPDAFAKHVERARSFTAAVPPFNQMLVKRFGLWFWDEDRDFDIDAHVEHIALPKPGRIRELLALVSKLHSMLMDRAKPLWEVYYIEGVEGGRAAMYVKFHHAFVDGVAGARMLTRAMTGDPDERELRPLWAKNPAARAAAAAKSAPTTVLGQVATLARQQAAALPRVAREITRTLRDSTRDPNDVSLFQAPASILNQEISASRRFAAQDWELSRIRHVAHQCGATLNDVVLAMCATALRKYLIEMNALPTKPLIAMVPVSLRDDDTDSGNRVAMVLGNLATNEENPFKRLQLIKRSMKVSKDRFSRMNQLEIMEYVSTTMSLEGLNVALGLMPKKQAFNVIISNVPGPRHKLYNNGFEITGAYPVSIVVDGQALNITLNSYGDKMAFGLIACSRTLPKMQRLLQYLEEGLAELEGAPEAAPAPKAKKAAAPKAKKPKAEKPEAKAKTRKRAKAKTAK